MAYLAHPLLLKNSQRDSPFKFTVPLMVGERLSNIDFDYWAGRYEKDYADDIRGHYPKFIDESGKEHMEKSPYFTTISKFLQRRRHIRKPEFLSMTLWKTRRQWKRYKANIDEEIQMTTKWAMVVPADRLKLAILTTLNGIGVPVASAVLTMIYPDKYCVIDFRTWRVLKHLSSALGSEYPKRPKSYEYSTINSYLSFLDKIRKIAKERGTTPRKIEMAMWKFDKEKEAT